MTYSLMINGKSHQVDVAANTPLLWVIRDVLNMNGTKFGCAVGLCGACTVHVDGVAKRSCLTPISTVGTAKITTIEGVGATPTGSKVQTAWVEEDVAQCGYCQPGQIMSASALLAKTPKPTDADIDSAMRGNVCRCGTYTRIRQAIHKAAQS
jgi:isoquinoline 1-oxidoreductase alpha subunit